MPKATHQYTKGTDSALRKLEAQHVAATAKYRAGLQRIETARTFEEEKPHLEHGDAALEECSALEDAALALPITTQRQLDLVGRMFVRSFTGEPWDLSCSIPLLARMLDAAEQNGLSVNINFGADALLT